MALSTNDAAVLSQIFDPESLPQAPLNIDRSLLPFPNIAHSTLTQLQSTELLAIRAAESNDFSKAISLLSDLIASHPTYPSAYNNRAQVYRISVSSDPISMDNLHSPTRSSDVKHAYDDLSKAISLASPATPSDALSQRQANLLANAYTQRGTIAFVTGKYISHEENVIDGLDDVEKRQKEREMWEQKASRDFYWGGRYGNEVAKAMAVHTNPYAKMCGNIVKEAMKKEMEES